MQGLVRKLPPLSEVKIWYFFLEDEINSLIHLILLNIYLSLYRYLLIRIPLAVT